VPTPAATLNVVQLSKQRLVAQDKLRQAQKELATLKARDPPASEDEVSAHQQIVDDAQLKYDTLMSIETV
jgi:hypothetical protein